MYVRHISPEARKAQENFQPNAKPDFVPRKKQAQEGEVSKKMPKPNIELLNADFDSRMYGRIDRARTQVEWEDTCNILLNAHRNSNLRDGVRAEFVARCPFKDIASLIRSRIG